MAKAKVKAKTKVKSKTKTKAPVKSKSKVKAPVKKSKVKAKAKIKVKAKAAKTKTVKAKVKVKTPVKSKTQAKQPVTKKVVKPVALNISNFVTPLDDRIFVRVTTAERVTAGGIYIPDTAQVTGNKKGEVLVVGRGHMNKKGRIRSLDVQKGEFVLFPENAGTQLELQGQEIICLRESEILAITTK